MKLRIETPIKAFIESATEEELSDLRENLTYTNTSAQYLLKRHYNNHTWRSRDIDGWNNRLEVLKKNVKQTLVFEENGRLFIRPASIPYLNIANCDITNTVKYPTMHKVAWNKPLPFDLHPYQEESWPALLSIYPHGAISNVELCTGAGKSAILMKVCRESGFRTAIIAPSQSIFEELVEKFEKHLGKSQVGKFGDGKKILGKRFTICIGKSITNVKPGTKEWEFFSQLDMICVDESHTWGADTLEEICHGVFSEVPYRLFFSGTQTRGDGSAKLLQSIIGLTVHTLTTKEAVAGGYICPHDYKIVEIESSNPNYIANDPLEMKRVHFLNNRNIAAFIAKLIKVEALKRRQTLVLVEELGQIAMIVKLLQGSGIPIAIAHSETKPARLAELGLEKVDPAESVEKFNRGEALALIGTSCISTGTNIYPTHNTMNWQGGSSEVKTKQGAVGRSVRLHDQNPWKENCVEKQKATIWDFAIYDINLMERHLEDRIAYYSDSGSEIKRIRLNAKKQTAGGFR
jgi:superfamily II DNA or RNA helicase